jgi:hypothetical protein
MFLSHTKRKLKDKNLEIMPPVPKVEPDYCLVSCDTFAGAERPTTLRVVEMN